MTRFARAKGSKASNERVPESSTPWSVMKEDMQRVQQEKKDNKERQKIDKIRQENYNNFLKEQKSDVKNEWADFSDGEYKSKKKDIKMGKGVEKVKSKNEEKVKLSKDEIKKMLRPDPEIDSQVEKLTTKIDKILKKEESSKKKAKKQSVNNGLTNETQDESVKSGKSPKKLNENKNKSGKLQSNDDDAPMEVSAKIDTPKVYISKKAKKKQILLKIESVKKSLDKDLQNSPTKSENNINSTESTENDSKSTSNNKNGEPQKMTKSMKKRLMKKKKLQAQKLLNPKSETNESEKKKQPKPKKQKKPTPEGENANQDSVKNVNKNWKDSNKQFNNRKRKFSSEDNYENPNKFPRKQRKMKVAKVRDNLEHKRRKLDEFACGPVKMEINGLEFEIVKFDGFPVKKEDADRLHGLKKQMISKGIPRSEVKRTLQLERRKAEKALAREKKKVCFQCRKAGHMLSECPDLNREVSTTGTGICFKCGSTEHTHFECKVTKGEEFKFASCFICKEQGHIARQCPDNPKGLYPQGGACRICGDVTHLKKDCPQLQQEREDNSAFLNTISSGNLEIDEDTVKIQSKPIPVKNKVVKF